MGNLTRPRVPKPRRPRLDLSRIHDNAVQNAAVKLQANQQPQLDADFFDASKQELDNVHQQAQATGEVEPSVQYPGMPHHPVTFIDYDSNGNARPKTATMGKTTLFNLLLDDWGPRRAEEMVRNMAARNPAGRPDPFEILPAIHPRGADAHFDRPAYVVRQDGPPLLNAFAIPGHDVIRVAKADEGNLTAAKPHETGHLAQDWGGYHMDGRIDYGNGGVRPDKKDFWVALMKDQGNTLALNDKVREMLEKVADEYGFDFDVAQAEPGVISQADYVDMLGANAAGYPYKQAERRAIASAWKSLALQRAGYETISDLPKGLSERDFIRQALTEDLVPFAPREAVDGFNPDDYNWHQMRMRPFHESLLEKYKPIHERLIWSVGAGLPAAVGLSQGNKEQ